MNFAQMELEKALSIVRAAGYRVTYPKGKTKQNETKQGVATVNPLGHAFPHAKLYNVTLTKINRLFKGEQPRTIDNSDIRNQAITRAAEVREKYGWGKMG